MRKKRDGYLYIIIIIMGIISILSLCFAGVTSYLYKQEKEEVIEVMGQNEWMEEQVEALKQSDNISQSEVDALLEQSENEVHQSMKNKMKELVVAKGGGPLTMLRYFFPENLIYYDEGTYEFIPILDSVKKHSLLSDNFVVNEKGEIEYYENNELVSHKGIDVSKYQGKIDWNAVKEDGIEYAFIRLGIRGYHSGEIVLDEYYKDNMRGANEAGVLAGVYFFTQAISEEEAIEEAEFVIDHLSDYDVPCPVVFDVEMITNGNGRANQLSQEERTNITIAFCEKIKSAGYVPMIYGNIKCFTKMLDITKLEDYEKWYAFYDKYMYFPYDVSIWQYSEKGNVKGIKGNVDLNISYKLW